ncbi:MAG: histidine triad nucleotide-binding protein [Dehalococcoidales bacterium]|nr:histidine triad nucleotide-binding protein [Dehalococcoidales bacterium]MDP6449108.1 histidine triad nucleotide-binding protein [Dehalococcoidales bacterium]MDP6577111.1 histidine triad nucleotide-binding protein [Dehalococcoidales bacterium]MDP6824660.1 histidine triad nucleotide-binding protein [Dehalococcoidales bacterium]MDP7415275.1 histidine triad nucleotide-binding protein [Dehalococcoidales bacterium]
MDCVFCQIVAGKIPSTTLYQDEEVLAFWDINPMAPTHILIIPKKHIPSLANITDDESPLIGRMAKVANRLAKEAGVSESGYRLVVSSGEDGGQVVPHLHMHLLGGRKLSARPC